MLLDLPTINMVVEALALIAAYRLPRPDQVSETGHVTSAIWPTFWVYKLKVSHPYASFNKFRSRTHSQPKGANFYNSLQQIPPFPVQTFSIKGRKEKHESRFSKKKRFTIIFLISLSVKTRAEVCPNIIPSQPPPSLQNIQSLSQSNPLPRTELRLFIGNFTNSIVNFFLKLGFDKPIKFS